MLGAWDRHEPPASGLIDDCVHCGFCLSSCPSYDVFEQEMDSPRGRIVLMAVGHEPGSGISSEMLTHFDRCLGCMACVTACPSGVRYDRLIEQTRPQLERNGPRTARQRAYRRAIFGLFTHPGRLRVTVPALALHHRLRLAERMPRRGPLARLRAIAALAPRVSLAAAVSRLAEVTPAQPESARQGTVALMQGCLQRVYFGEVNAATVRVLSAEGWEVHAPRTPRCCGALELHAGLRDGAAELAKATIATFEGYDAVIVNVAGCGSALKAYGHLLGDDPAWARRAARFAERVLDVHELLASRPGGAPRHPLALRLAYHDACHLGHAQGVREQPRALLRSIPGVELVEPAGWEKCCGSAGIYNLTHADAAAQLGRRKATSLLATGAAAIAAANPGCALQVAAHLPADGPPVYHPIAILDRSLRGESL
jgi:glycolate oxidase iron-sulfur subunit